LADVPDALTHAPRLAQQVMTRDRRLTAGGPEQRHQHPQRGGLARPVGAQEPEDLALRDRQVDAVHGDHVALPPERPAQPSGLDHLAGHSSSFPGSLPVVLPPTDYLRD
jgi:hypothetical protein